MLLRWRLEFAGQEMLLLNHYAKNNLKYYKLNTQKKIFMRTSFSLKIDAKKLQITYGQFLKIKTLKKFHERYEYL
jgi:hypothetical protein